MNDRSAWYVGILLALLAALMGAHLALIKSGVNACDFYEKILLERLRKSKVGSIEAIAIRRELAEYLSGKTSECAEIESVYQQASDKYMSVLLALLTGASAAGGVALGIRGRKQDSSSVLADDAPPPD
jgi:hypothetical protein